MRVHEMLKKLFYKLAPEFDEAKKQTEAHREQVEKAEKTQADMRHSVNEALRRVRREADAPPVPNGAGDR